MARNSICLISVRTWVIWLFALCFIPIRVLFSLPVSHSELMPVGTGTDINESSDDRSMTLIYFWMFDTSLPNDYPLETIGPRYSATGSGQLSFQSALAGYPFNPEHPLWRKASMERRNAPTPLNYRPEGNNGLTYEQSSMRGIQIKQPFQGNGGQNTIIFSIPTTGFQKVIFRFASKDEGAAQNLVIDYSINEGTPVWTQAGLMNPSPNLTADYQLFELDFSNISPADNNLHFKLRIRFQGTNMTIDEGKRVTFNNFSLDGYPLSGVNLPPVVIQPIPLQELIEEGNALILNLNNIFSDPNNDPLTFSIENNHAWMVNAMLSGNTATFIPVKRGGATITLKATDGFHPPAVTTFRILVYPRAFPLKNGSFNFTAWYPDEPDYSYPEHILFLQSDIDDPGLNDPLLYPYFIPHDDYHPDDQGNIGFPYNNTRRTRINALGENGIAFINTGRGRDLGGLLLALDTRQVQNASLDWLAGTILKNERVYAIRLLYRTHINQPFFDFTHLNEIIQYTTGNDGEMQQFSNLSLPSNALGKEYVQLLWKYFFVYGESGTRAQLRLDDILIRDVTGLNEPQIYHWQINYANGLIFIRSEQPITGTILLYDPMGRLINTMNCSNTTEINFHPGAGKGIYFIGLKDYTGIVFRKIPLYE